MPASPISTARSRLRSSPSLLAAAFGAATEALTRRETRPGVAISTALFATGTLGALALALTFALEKGWLTIALALMSLGTAWISMQRPIPFLRWLAAIFAAIVTARIAYDPRIVGDAVGTTPIFNWLLWGYGLPGGCRSGARASSCAAAPTTRRCAWLRPPRSCSPRCSPSWRSATSPPAASMIAPPSLLECALQVCVTLADGDRAGTAAAAQPQHRSQYRRARAHRDRRASISVFGLLILENPLLWQHRRRRPVFNLLLLGYALPAVLMLLLSYAVAGDRGKAYANTIAGGALVFALAYVTLEIRRFYHGPILSSGQTTGAEQYTYSIGWLAFGVVAARRRHPRQLGAWRDWPPPWSSR